MPKRKASPAADKEGGSGASSDADSQEGSGASPPPRKAPRPPPARTAAGMRKSLPKKPPPKHMPDPPSETASTSAPRAPSPEEGCTNPVLEEDWWKRRKHMPIHAFITEKKVKDETGKKEKVIAIYVATAVLALVFGYRFNGEKGEMRAHVGATFPFVLPGLGSAYVTVDGEIGKFTRLVAKGKDRKKLKKLLRKAKIEYGKNWVLLFACQGAAGRGYTIPAVDAKTPAGLPIGQLPAKNPDGTFPEHAFKLGMMPAHLPKVEGFDESLKERVASTGFKANWLKAVIMMACLCKDYNFRAFRYLEFSEGVFKVQGEWRGKGRGKKLHRHLFYCLDDSDKLFGPLRLIGWSDRSMSYVFKSVDEPTFDKAEGAMKGDPDPFVDFFTTAGIWTGDRIAVIPGTFTEEEDSEEWVVVRMEPRFVDAVKLRAVLETL